MYEELNNEQLKLKIREIASFINLYHKDQVRRIRQRWKFNLFYWFLLGIGGLLDLALSKSKVLGNSMSDEFNFIIFCTAMILPSFYVLSQKRRGLNLDNLNGNSRKELEKRFYDLTKQEEQQMEASARDNANTLSFFVLLLQLVILFLKPSRDAHVPSFWQKAFQGGEKEFTIIIIAYFICFFIGLLISRPMTPKRYLREKGLIKNKLIEYLISYHVFSALK